VNIFPATIQNCPNRCKKQAKNSKLHDNVENNARITGRILFVKFKFEANEVVHVIRVVHRHDTDRSAVRLPRALNAVLYNQLILSSLNQEYDNFLRIANYMINSAFIYLRSY